MNRLEKYIIKNRGKFESEEPGEGHFERFHNRLQARERSSSRFSWKNLLKVAAVILLLLGSTLLIYFGSNQNEVQFITLADIDPEYREAEIYYTSLINRKYNEIISFDFHGNTGEKELLLRELSEMDNTYRILEQELNAEAGNRKVVDAMLMHYQLKVDIMGMILDRLQESGMVRQLYEENEDERGLTVTG